MDAYEAVSEPQISSRAGQRYFSVTEANRALVLVRRIVTDIVRDYQRLRELHDAHQLHDSHGNAALAEQARQDYIRTVDRLSELRDELAEIGCELKDYDLGLVDFPSMREGREILLCWKLGEESVEHWHEIDGGFGGRQRLFED